MQQSYERKLLGRNFFEKHFIPNIQEEIVLAYYSQMLYVLCVCDWLVKILLWTDKALSLWT